MSDVVDMTSGVYRRVYAGYIAGHRINGMSLEAEAWFWRLNAVADDYGNMRAEPSLLVAETVGLRQIKTERVLALVDEIVAAGLAYRYQVGRDQYLHIVGFEERQPCGRNGRRFKRHPLHPDAPSCIPVNPGESGGIQNNPGAPMPSPNPIPIPTPTREEPPSGGGVGLAPAKAEKTRPTGADLPGFAEWWGLYPSENGRKGDKKACVKKWVVDGLEPRAAEVIKALRKFVKSSKWKEQGGQFIPAPLVWLNRGQYENPPPTEMHPLAKRVTYADYLKLEASFGQGPAIEPPSRAFDATTLPEGGLDTRTQQGGSNGK